MVDCGGGGGRACIVVVVVEVVVVAGQSNDWFGDVTPIGRRLAAVSTKTQTGKEEKIKGRNIFVTCNFFFSETCFHQDCETQ